MATTPHNTPQTLIRDLIDSYAAGRIRHHANRLCRSTGFIPGDRDDIAQELRIELVNAMHKFDPQRSSQRTFIESVLRMRCHTLRRRATTLRASAQRLAEPLGGVDVSGIESDRRLHMTGYDATAGQDPTQGLEREEAAHAVQTAIAALPTERMRSVAKILLTGTQADAARALNVASATIYRDCRKIRKHFEQAGLEPNVE